MRSSPFNLAEFKKYSEKNYMQVHVVVVFTMIEITPHPGFPQVPSVSLRSIII